MNPDLERRLRAEAADFPATADPALGRRIIAGLPRTAPALARPGLRWWPMLAAVVPVLVAVIAAWWRPAEVETAAVATVPTVMVAVPELPALPTQDPLSREIEALRGDLAGAAGFLVQILPVGVVSAP
jgi:hypothetical protein